MASKFNHDAFYLIVTFNSESVGMEWDILDRFYYTQLTNVYLMTHGSDIATIMTSRPSRAGTAETCYSPQKTNHNYYIGQTHDFYPKFEQMFTDLFTDMNYCPIDILLNEYEPFTIVEKHSNGSITVGGIEGGILRELEQIIQYTPNYTLYEAGNKSEFKSIFHQVFGIPLCFLYEKL